MSDLLTGLGLFFVLEGLIWALFPGVALRLLQSAAEQPEVILRLAGAASVAIGVGLVWLVRG